MDPTNYFIVVLSGFMIVWSFRFWAGYTEKIGEFEYAAFSALWGIPMAILLITYLQSPRAQLHQTAQLVNSFPMFGTLLLLPIGLFVGTVGGLALGKPWDNLKSWLKKRHVR
jgi:hypothetical protein